MADRHAERLERAIEVVVALMQADRHDGHRYAPILARLKSERDAYTKAIS